MSDNSLSLQTGRTIIQRYVETMPHTPGVYRMIDHAGNVLYVGKAKSLKNRASSYLNVGALNARLQRMVSQTASMEIITTRSEAEALLLEANLVKKFAPRYNILLKDDKSFPYIFLSGDHEYPCITKHRGPKTKKGKYYGPFVSAGAVNETLAILQKAFLLRPCSDSVFNSRTRPCLQYQIKRCSAPCVNKISKEDYAELVEQAQAFLSGKNQEIQQELIEEMQTYSLQMNYEKARIIRDRIRALTTVQQQHDLDNEAVGNVDIFVLAREGMQCCIQLFSVRAGRNYGNRSWFPTHSEDYSDSEILETFIAQFYQTQLPPQTILVNAVIHEVSLLEEALQLQAQYKVEIVQPLRGEKRKLLDQALVNARQALIRHMTMSATQQEVLASLQSLFGLEDAPQRIEVYDNSHISGVHATGAMIVAGPDGFIKSEYRKFNIKDESTVPGDDYAMMREVLMRRFKRLEGEAGAVPDLVLIDGGAGQLSTAMAVFEELGVQNIALVAIAKGPDRNAGREQFFMPGKAPFQLPMDDAALHYLQRLRDEAHRFAIGTHRNKRSKSMQVSELDQIPGIGSVRKKALLMHFGSAKAVAAASVEEIAKVENINRVTAEMIFAHFHGEA
ncbi:MAG: excinuclease ABC subunit UvrC [Rickettsiales bacterium]|nr:excinuclease ABC subunit UvrC [Rickettsiales bacterium]